jgi:hypothetical protein
MDYRFKRQISDSERTQELHGKIARGNHRSAEKEADKAAALLAKDVFHSFLIPILPKTVPLIKGAMAQPLGLATQFALVEDGSSRKEMFRLMQDLSFSLSEQLNSINEWLDMDEYPEMMLWLVCISNHPLHCQLEARIPHSQQIFIAKYDYSNAY